MAPGNDSRAWFQIHSAPSPSTLTEAGAAIPRRFIPSPHFGPNASIPSMAAKPTRTLGAGRCRRSSSSGVLGSPSGRLAKTPIFMSRQPPVVLTFAASVWNSTAPFALPNGAAAAGDRASKSATPAASR